MGKPNYRQIYAIKNASAKKLKIVCPELSHNSGIYFYTRLKPQAYIGKSVDVTERCVQHDTLHEQHIDNSLYVHKYYNKEKNPYGWKLNVLYFPKEMLDEKERYYIDLYQKNGYELLNKESGGTTGKTLINERKPNKNYTDGLKQGKKIICRELSVIADKYLTIGLKKDNKLSHKMLDKFNNILKGENDVNNCE